MTQQHPCVDVIGTARLELRPFAATDAVRVCELAGDADVARMTARIPHPYPLAAAETWIAGHEAARAEGREFPFAITLPATGPGSHLGSGLIGACGVTRQAPGADVWELGYWLGRTWWGQGLATEAARGLMDWSRTALGAIAFTAGHFIDNPASGAILRKLGFVLTRRVEFYGLARGGKASSDRYLWPADADPSIEVGVAGH